jgi:hypothetical protein
VARGTQHRKRRTTGNARVAGPAHQQAAPRPKRVQHQKWEDQLFFARLRNHGKFLWYLLAMALIAAFVLLGVGSGSTGISQIVQNFFSGTSASGKSLSSLQKATVQHPKDAAAWLAYANKLQAKNKLDDAATALTTYTTLKPKDEEAMRQLAAIYVRRASDWNTIYTAQRARSDAYAPTAVLTPKAGTPLADALGTITNPLTAAVTTDTNTVTSTAYQQVISALTSREGVWKKIAVLSPRDASTQLSLAQSATDVANVLNQPADMKTAIAAYKAYLRLAPNDSSASSAKQQLKTLEKTLKASVAASASTSTTTTTTGK